MEVKPGTKEYRKANLKTMQNWPLYYKILHSLKRINEFYEAQDGKVYIAFSGGKDSCVLLHLVRSMYPDTMGVFSNTTNEYVEILQHVRDTPNITWVHPKMNFKDTVSTYGFPLVSKKVSVQINRIRDTRPETFNSRNLYLTGYTKDGHFSKTWKLSEKWKFLKDVDFEITAKCCDILKKEPFERFQKETGLRPIIGTQASESAARLSTWFNEGCNIYNSKHPMSKPLSIWTEDDIWAYIKLFKVPYSSIYDDILDEKGNVMIEGEKRTGCAYCAFGAHLEKGSNRFQRLALRKPHQFEKMMNLTNNGITFRDALISIGVSPTKETE